MVTNFIGAHYSQNRRFRQALFALLRLRCWGRSVAVTLARASGSTYRLFHGSAFRCTNMIYPADLKR